jgi:hypothetical protein
MQHPVFFPHGILLRHNASKMFFRHTMDGVTRKL